MQSNFPKKVLIFATLFYFLMNIAAYAEITWNFSESKKFAKDIYSGNETTFYCGCSYQVKGKNLFLTGIPVVIFRGINTQSQEN